MTTKLMPDTQAPALSVPLVGGGTWTLAEQTPKNFTMVVFYRGLHCPVCKSYIGKLDELVGTFADVGVDAIAVSMDTQERAEKTKADWGLSTVRLGYGLSEADARTWGLYVSKAIKEAEAEIFCEPGLFWVRPDGRLYLIDVSNMPWARPDLAFLASKVSFAVENGYPARGGHTG